MVSYKCTRGSSAPNDTIIISHFFSYYKTKTEPSDSILGTRFLCYLKGTSKMYLSYYNKIAVRYNWKTKNIIIDTL